MRKITFILATVACLFLASCTTDYSCTYIMGHYVTTSSCAGESTSAAALIHQEFKDEIIAYENAHKNEWEWTVTVRGENYDESDKEALAKYEKVAADIEAINSKYVKKFEECTATDYEMEQIHYVELKRFSHTDATLGHKDLYISFGE